MLASGSSSASRALALALGLSSAALLVGLGWWWSQGRTPELLDFRPPSSAMRVLIEEGVDPREVEWIPPRPGSSLARFRISREMADRLWNGRFGAWTHDEYDPWSHYRSKALIDVLCRLGEHPRGAWRMRTNSLGLRRDAEIAPVRPRLRVVVTGDSHTEGVCDNGESFCGLLEAALAVRTSAGEVEILNAGKFGYSFYNYLGTLERLAPLAPHVALVVVYGGNDFHEALPLRHLFTGNTKPEFLSLAHLRELRKASEISRPLLGQGLISIRKFQLHPREIELALATALEVSREMKALADGEGFRLVIAYLPPRTDLGGLEMLPGARQMARMLDLSAGDLEITNRLADRYLAGLAEL